MARQIDHVTRGLYKAARTSNNVSAVTSGSARRIVRRGKNVIVGRALFGRRGLLRNIWR